MWVQEGGDCKDADENISGSSLSSFRSRFWLSNRNKKKQTITTIGIPMRKPKKNKPKQNNNPQKDVNKQTKQETKMETDSNEEKERESSPFSSPKMQGAQRSVTLSPAQFIENAGSKKTKKFDLDGLMNNKVDDISMVTIDDGKMDDDALQKWIDADDDDYDDGDVTMDGDFTVDDKDQIEDDAVDPNLDLTIIGKQIAYLFDAVPVDPNENESDNDNNVKKQEVNEDNFYDDLNEKPLYIAQAFKGLDIKNENEWDNCLNNNKENENGLLIIELYSQIFGASNVMYSLIDEILFNKKQENDKIEFVRLSSEKLNEINIIKDVINDFECYISTPIPTYIFVKDGKKIDLLKGTKPGDFEKLIDKYSKNKEVNQDENGLFADETAKKYKSILTERPSSSYLVSTMNWMNNNKENKSQASNVENIKNLINKLDISSNQTTKLSKKNKKSSSSISCGTSTQSMFY